MAAELLKARESDVESLTVRTGSGGVFEVVVDGETIFSKKALGRFPEDGEVLANL